MFAIDCIVFQPVSQLFTDEMVIFVCVSNYIEEFWLCDSSWCGCAVEGMLKSKTVLTISLSLSLSLSLFRPRELTFSWWGCYALCLSHKPTELAHSIYSVLVSVSVFMALSTVFHSINSPDNFPLSHSVLLVLFLPYWSFRLYISLWKYQSSLI